MYIDKIQGYLIENRYIKIKMHGSSLALIRGGSEKSQNMKTD